MKLSNLVTAHYIVYMFGDCRTVFQRFKLLKRVGCYIFPDEFTVGEHTEITRYLQNLTTLYLASTCSTMLTSHLSSILCSCYIVDESLYYYFIDWDVKRFLRMLTPHYIFTVIWIVLKMNLMYKYMPSI